MFNQFNYPYPNLTNANYTAMQNYNPTFNSPQSELIKVNGLEGAKAYQMQPNSVVPLFDMNSDILYIKVTDGAGFPSIRMFNFTELTNATPQPEIQVDYVSREEFEQFKKEMMNHGKQPIPKSKQQPASDDK